MGSFPGELTVAEAIDGMVVDHAGGLHHGVADGGTDKFETALEEILAEGIGLRRARGDFLHGTAAVDDGRATGEAPDVGIETAELALDGEEHLGVADRGGDLEAVAHDARIREELLHLAGVVAGDFDGIEAVEDFAVTLAFAENGVPTEA